MKSGVNPQLVGESPVIFDVCVKLICAVSPCRVAEYHRLRPVGCYSCCCAGEKGMDTNIYYVSQSNVTGRRDCDSHACLILHSCL